MTTIQLKNALIQRISEIEDKSFLQAIMTILDSKAESRIMTLTPEIKSAIIESRKEIEKGLYFENEQVESEFEEWLSEK